MLFTSVLDIQTLPSALPCPLLLGLLILPNLAIFSTQHDICLEAWASGNQGAGRQEKCPEERC